MVDEPCQVESFFWEKKRPCGKEATYWVADIDNDEGGVYSCRSHLHGAIVEVLGDPDTSRRMDAVVSRVRKRS
ncbi:hypothetical protein [Amycolatopsis sp. lyj-84]|uniref:hypothetical protein n=1 Tax=Amycolatopsis sp. lyj-84 TaxID=2789284 RepID=UPI00397A96A2